MKKVAEPQSPAPESVLKRSISFTSLLRSSLSDEKPTPLLLLNLISLKLNPKPVGKLVGKDSPKKNLRNWASEAFVESHLTGRCQ